MLSVHDKMLYENEGINFFPMDSTNVRERKIIQVFCIHLAFASARDIENIFFSHTTGITRRAGAY